MLFIVITLLVFITQYLLNYWWLAALDAFLATLLLGKSSWQAFLSGLFAVAIVWFAMAFYLNYQNEGILLERITQMLVTQTFGLQSNAWVLGATALVGGTLGGLSALMAYSIKSFWKQKK